MRNVGCRSQSVIGRKFVKCAVVVQATRVRHVRCRLQRDGVINCSNAQWSSGRHVCGMLGAGRKVGWGDKFFKRAVVVRATKVRHVGPRPHSGIV